MHVILERAIMAFVVIIRRVIMSLTPPAGMALAPLLKIALTAANVPMALISASAV